MFCPKCGTALAADCNYCFKCGRAIPAEARVAIPLPADNAAQASPPRPARPAPRLLAGPTRKQVFSLVFCALLLIGFCASVLIPAAAGVDADAKNTLPVIGFSISTFWYLWKVRNWKGWVGGIAGFGFSFLVLVLAGALRGHARQQADYPLQHTASNAAIEQQPTEPERAASGAASVPDSRPEPKNAAKPEAVPGNQHASLPAGSTNVPTLPPGWEFVPDREQPGPASPAPQSLDYSVFGLSPQASRRLDAAARGDVSAELRLGTMYLYGRGISQDVSQARFWLGKAAEQGNAKAMYLLGESYRGSGWPNIIAWWEKAAENGSADAQWSLGMEYQAGHGVARNYPKAIELLQRAAAQPGFPAAAAAEASIADMYADAYGFGGSKNYALALVWEQKAAAHNDTSAQLNLGEVYASGGWGLPKDLVLAHAWLRLASREQNFRVVVHQAMTEIEPLMTPAQIDEAKRLSLAWKKGLILTRAGVQPLPSD